MLLADFDQDVGWMASQPMWLALPERVDDLGHDLRGLVGLAGAVLPGGG